MADTDDHLDVGLMQYNLDSMASYVKWLKGEVPKLRFTVGPGGKPPTRAHAGDAGWDLYVSKAAAVEPGQFVDIRCDVCVQLPPGVWAMLTGRSSTLRKRGLLVNQGVIDNGYRGELYAGAWNLTQEPVEVEAGERLAQLIPMPLMPLMPAWVAELGDHDGRGTNGFGSTGS